MKNKWLKTVILACTTVGLLVGSAVAATLPMAFFDGLITVDGTNITNSVAVNRYIDIYGNEIDDSSVDSFIGQTVTGSAFNGISYDYVNDILTIDTTATALFYIGSDDGTDPYLTASASNISYESLGGHAYKVTALLANQQYYHTSDSDFMQQYMDASPATGTQGQLITWDIVFGVNPNYDYEINVCGSMAPVPEPATMLLFGTGLASLAGVVRRKKK